MKRWRTWTMMIAAVLMLSCVVSLCGCARRDIPQFDEVNEYGNSGGNIGNGAATAMQDDWLITSEEISKYGTSKLMMYSLDGDEEYTLKRDKFIILNGYGFWNPSIVGDNVYYSTNYSINSHRFFQYNIRTGKSVVIYKGYMRGYCADEENVFFVSRHPDSERKLNRYDISEGSCETILEGAFGNPFFENGIMYYFDLQYGFICSVDLYGDDIRPQKICEVPDDIELKDMVIDKGRVYIRSEDTIFSLSDTDGTFSPILYDEELSTFQVRGNLIIYTTVNYSSYDRINLYDMLSGESKIIHKDDAWIEFDLFDDYIVVYYPYGEKAADRYVYTLSGELVCAIEPD